MEAIDQMFQFMHYKRTLLDCLHTIHNYVKTIYIQKNLRVKCKAIRYEVFVNTNCLFYAVYKT